MFHGHPPVCYSLLRFSLSPSSPRKLKLHRQLHSLTLCCRHHQPLVELGGREEVLYGGGGVVVERKQHIRQLFCLDDSIISFSGIRISIIILIIAFELTLQKITRQVWNWWLWTCLRWILELVFFFFIKIHLYCVTLSRGNRTWRDKVVIQTTCTLFERLSKNQTKENKFFISQVLDMKKVLPAKTEISILLIIYGEKWKC